MLCSAITRNTMQNLKATCNTYDLVTSCTTGTPPCQHNVKGLFAAVTVMQCILHSVLSNSPLAAATDTQTSRSLPQIGTGRQIERSAVCCCGEVFCSLARREVTQSALVVTGRCAYSARTVLKFS